MISCGVQPESASRVSANFLRPWNEHSGGKPRLVAPFAEPSAESIAPIALAGLGGEQREMSVSGHGVEDSLQFGMHGNRQRHAGGGLGLFRPDGQDAVAEVLTPNAHGILAAQGGVEPEREPRL
jgi:hypothetical protein